MKNILFKPSAWNEYLSFKNDKKTLQKIENIIQDIARNAEIGLGKPEKLVGDLSGCYSRQIDKKNRIIYRFDETTCEILQVGGHYSDK